MDQESTEAKDLEAQRRVRRITLVLLALTALLFVWYLFADRLTPHTSAARVQAYIVAIVPDVSGYVADVPIKKNQLVKPGTKLIQIETERFEIAVRSAEAALEMAGQAIGADTADVSSATAKAAAARAQLTETREQASRILVLEEKGIYAKARGDQARAAIATSEAQAEAAEAELEKAKLEVGASGDANPRMRAALAKLQEARLNLTRTTLKAPSRGFVGGLKIDQGAYASAGSPLMSIISVDDIWIEAFFTENNLAYVNKGDKVELAFDAYPGQIFNGKVKSSAAGVSTGKLVNLGDLPTALKSRTWLREPQRFAVIIETTDYKQDFKRDTGLRLNSQVDVIIYTEDGFFWNAIGWIWIRVLSLFSYLY